LSKASYAIKKPSKSAGKGQRATFAIQEVTATSRHTLDLEPVDSINKLFLAGTITRNEAERQVEAVRAALYKQRDQDTPAAVFSSENLKLLDKYWKAEYSDRDLVDTETMKADLKRALGSVGVLSLVVASRSELQVAVNETYADKPNLQRRAVSRLNQLLRFAGRDFTLRKVKAVRADVPFLTWDELKTVLPHLPSDHWRLLAKVAWVTGCRVGEIFALSAASLKPKYLFVTAQIDKDGKRRETKTRSERKASILMQEQGRQCVTEWLAIPSGVRVALRSERHSTVFKRACKKAFPKEPLKLCKFHDLRHSYAIDLIGKGVPISLVSQAMGNSVAVCEKHYSGFVLQDEGIDTIQRLLNV